MAKLLGIAVIVVLAWLLYKGIGGFLDKPTASREELSTAASQFVPDGGRPGRRLAPGQVVHPSAESRAFRVDHKIEVPAAVFYHVSDRTPGGSPVTLRVPPEYYIETTGVSTGARFTFRIKPDVWARMPLDFQIPASRLTDMEHVTSIPSREPPSGYAATMPRGTGL